jgi:hypothetical protein
LQDLSQSTLATHVAFTFSIEAPMPDAFALLGGYCKLDDILMMLYTSRYGGLRRIVVNFKKKIYEESLRQLMRKILVCQDYSP